MDNLPTLKSHGSSPLNSQISTQQVQIYASLNNSSLPTFNCALSGALTDAANVLAEWRSLDGRYDLLAMPTEFSLRSGR